MSQQAEKNRPERATGKAASRRETIGLYLLEMEKKFHGKICPYAEIAKVVCNRKITPRKDYAETKMIANSGASVRDWLQKVHNADLLVANGGMRALVTDEDKARFRLPQTERRVASAHLSHAKSFAVTDVRKIKDPELRHAVEDRYQPIARFGERIAGLLPTRKPDRG